MTPTRKFRVSANQVSGLNRFIERLPMNSTGAELGSAYGESMAMFMKSGRVRRMLCVDTWEGDKAERERHFDARAKQWGERVGKAKATTARVGHGLWRPDRDDDDWFDWVYVDAMHDEKSVIADIRIWWRLIRVGGFMGGHDFKKGEGVAAAVAKCFGAPDEIFADSSWIVQKKFEEQQKLGPIVTGGFRQQTMQKIDIK